MNLVIVEEYLLLICKELYTSKVDPPIHDEKWVFTPYNENIIQYKHLPKGMYYRIIIAHLPLNKAKYLSSCILLPPIPNIKSQFSKDDIDQLLKVIDGLSYSHTDDLDQTGVPDKKADYRLVIDFKDINKEFLRLTHNLPKAFDPVMEQVFNNDTTIYKEIMYEHEGRRVIQGEYIW